MTRRWLAGLGAGASLAALPFAAGAQMVGGEVTHGSATVAQHQTGTGTHTQIDTHTRRTAMRWSKHDVLVGDSVRIEQPTKGSAYLARVSDASVTQINGTLTSNGQVWIANPAGVYFGGSAVVDVARLVAGAGSISNQAFVYGAEHFTNLRGAITLEDGGSISAAGSVSLIGQTVANHGRIVSRRGDIVLAAGDDVWIRRHDTHIEIHVPDAAGGGMEDGGETEDSSSATSAGAAPAPRQPAVENTGTLEARGRNGRARLAAGDFLGLAIRNSGTIYARNIALSAGVGSVVDVAGTLDASSDRAGRTGGSVEIEGDAIFLRDAKIDASGRAGGGEVRIGGEVAGGTGAAGDLRNARAVFFSDDSVVRADATENGDGGSIVLWSDQLTVVEGALSARGGAEGGDGGFIETSSKGQLIVTADTDVSAAAGESGTWLLDPINVRIVEEADIPELTETAVPNETLFDFLPDFEDREIPAVSFVSTESLVNALVRGGLVEVTTEARFLTLTGDGVGDITVEAPIVVGSGEPVQADQASTLRLLAANDITVLGQGDLDPDGDPIAESARIASENDNLLLSVELSANSNEDTETFTFGQREDDDQKGIGSVSINADITTNGGRFFAAGVEVDLKSGATIDTRYFGNSPDLSLNGGAVQLFAGDISGDDRVGTVTLAGSIITGGGTLISSGDDFLLTNTGNIDVFGTAASDDEIRLGAIDLDFNRDLTLEGDVSGEFLLIDAAQDGEGTLTIGAVTLTGDLIDLRAIRFDSSSNDPANASIVIDAAASFEGTGGNTNNPTAPREFSFLQDNPIVDANLPNADQFGDRPTPPPNQPNEPSPVQDMLYRIEVNVGADDGVPDMILATASKFADSNLDLAVPDSIELQNEIHPKNLFLSVREGFEVSADLASKLRPVSTDEDAGILRIQGAADGKGDLTFENNAIDPVSVILTAEHISLEAGTSNIFNIDGSISGNESQVFAQNADETQDIQINAGKSLRIIQDGDLGTANIPTADQLGGATGPDPLDYSLVSQGESVTFSPEDASKVEGTDLTVTVQKSIEFEDEEDPTLPVTTLSVHSADLGSFSSFEVTEKLLDRVSIDAPGEARILTLRAGGQLSFQRDTEDDDGNTVPIQLRVEAERIHLVGSTIDVASGRPIFQSGNFLSPERFIFDHSTNIGDSALPTEENFPDDPAGRGPSELFVVRSTTTTAITQTGDQTDPRPGAETDRFWRFPVHDETRVIITGSFANIARNDGFNVVLGEYDNVWTTSANLQSLFIGGADEDGNLKLDPIGFGAVDAGAVESILGFDTGIDFTETDFGTPEDSEGLPLTIGFFGIQQDASLLLHSGDEARLPSFGGGVVQPDTYRLDTREGRIDLRNALFQDTNLQLSVTTPQPDDTFNEIQFDADILNVTSLDAQIGGAFEFDSDTHVVAEGSIALISDALGNAAEGEGDLTFGTGVTLEAERIDLVAGGPATTSLAVVDARTNAPKFLLEDDGTFFIQQGGMIRNGVDVGPNFGDIDWGQLPDPYEQFVQTPGDPLPQLALYRLVSRASDVEINDPSEVQVARTIQLQAGTEELPAAVTLRADPGPISHPGGAGICDDEAICGNATDPMTGLPLLDLDVIPDDSIIEAFYLTAARVLLEAPEGKVVVGEPQVLARTTDQRDPRVSFTLVGENPVFAVRQRTAITTADATNLPDQLQIEVAPSLDDGTRQVPYAVQALEGLEVGSNLADRVKDTNLTLLAGLTEVDLDASKGSVRGKAPENDGDPFYDRFADLNGDGVVDDDDDDERIDLIANFSPQVLIYEANTPFDLTLRSLRIRSEADDDIPIVLGSVTIQTESDQIYEDDIQLADPGLDGIVGGGDDFASVTILSARAGLLEQLNPLITPSGSSIIFQEEVFGGATGDEDLIVEATNRVRFAKDVGVEQGLQLGVLTINLQQLIQFEDPPPTPRAEFGTVDRGGEIHVAAREIRLNPQDPEEDGRTSLFVREDIPDAATFFRLGGSLVFDVGGRNGEAGIFEMGKHEKLSVDGSALRILTNGGTATVGDLAAIDEIVVDAADLRMRRRGGAKVLRANGRKLEDSGVDYVANTIDFRNGPVEHSSDSLHKAQVGSGRDAKFGVADTTRAPSFMDNFSVVSLQYNILTGSGLEFGGGDLAVDGIPDGISRAELAETYADDRPVVTIGVPAAYRVQHPETLRDVGIDARLPSREELHAAARGAATFYDLGSLRGSSDSPTLKVSEARLVAHEVEKAVSLHDEVFASDGSRSPHVRDVLQRAVDDYRRSTGARRVVGFELRRYVYNRPSSQFAAYQELQKLDSLFRHHRRSGLTATEYRTVQKAWLESIRPDGITAQELSEFVHPSRYVRGSDVLDVFGD